MTRFALPALLLAANPSAFAAPVVVWYSDPVRPDETVLLYGDGFGPSSKVEITRLPDGPSTALGAGDRGAPAKPAVDWAKAAPCSVLSASPRSLKFAVPKTTKFGLYACRVTDGAGASAQVILNRPKPIWVQGDGGSYAHPGGMVQVMGRCVAAPGGEPMVMLASGGKTTLLAATCCGSEANEFAITAKLPAGLALGEYQVRAHNGYGGPAGWSEALALPVRSDQLPQKLFKVTDYGADGWDSQDDTLGVLGALEAAGAAGGGVVFFPRGNYTITDALKVPRNVTLRGEAREAVVLAWPDTDEPPPAWIAGQDHFALEDITLYCSNYRNFITASQGTPEAGTVRLERVRVRANIYNYHRTEAEVDQRFRDSLKLSTGGGDLLQLGGRDVVVRDCDLYGSGRSLYLSRCRGALLSGNRFYNGRWGWYCISGSDGVIFENNDLVGADLMSTGGGLNCLDGSMYSQNVYFAYNRLRNMFGWDREAMTSDAGGGAYAGAVASADAGSVTCAGDPKWSGDWKGAAVFVLDGKGMGQYRRVAGYDGRRIAVEAPWDIVPDATSTISVTMLQRNYLLIGNSFEDAGIAIQFFGTSVDHICAGNTTARTGGFHNWGLDYYGEQPTWFVQWLDNRITEGNVFSTGGVGTVHLATFCTPPGDWQHPLALGSIMRRNELSNGGRIEFGSTSPGTPPDRLRLTQTAVIEHNTVRDAPVGIAVLPGTPDVLIRDNTFERVDMPLFDEKEVQRRAQERRKQMSLRQDPVLHLALDEVQGKVTPDDSGMGLNGVLEGKVDMTQAGVRGKCATFDGASRIVVPRGAMLDLDNVTVSAWIKPAKVDGRFGIVAKRNAGAAAPFILTAAHGALAFEATDSAGAWSFNFNAPGGTIKPGEWQHVAAVHEFGKGVTLYLNGQPVATKENPLGVMGNSQPLCIGWEAWGGPSAAGENIGYFFGAIDEVTIWARPLKAEEVAKLAAR